MEQRCSPIRSCVWFLPPTHGRADILFVRPARLPLFPKTHVGHVPTTHNALGAPESAATRDRLGDASRKGAAGFAVNAQRVTALVDTHKRGVNRQRRGKQHPSGGNGGRSGHACVCVTSKLAASGTTPTHRSRQPALRRAEQLCAINRRGLGKGLCSYGERNASTEPFLGPAPSIKPLLATRDAPSVHHAFPAFPLHQTRSLAMQRSGCITSHRIQRQEGSNRFLDARLDGNRCSREYCATRSRSLLSIAPCGRWTRGGPDTCYGEGLHSCCSTGFE